MRDDPALRFVGRADELGVLRDALGKARDGSPTVVLVEGAAGIGKTALVRRFLRDTSGLNVLWASGDEEETDLEFGVVEQLRQAMPAQELASPAPAAGMGSLAVGADLLAGLGTLEQDAPVVLVIDDLHLADSASSRALLFALRRLRRDQVLVVATTRPQSLDRLGAGWARIFADGELARVVRLGGLDGGEVRELAAAYGRVLQAQVGERLRAHTDGNPLYVRVLLDELPAEALRNEAAELPVPHSYAATVLGRLARLPGPARAVVTAAAVLGTTRASLRAVAAVCRVEDPSVAAEPAVAAGLVRVIAGPDGDEVEFTHPLVRAAVYDDLSLARRRDLHQAAAGTVDLPAALRHLVAAAEGPDAVLAARLCSVAEQELARGALPAGATFFELASRVEPDEAAGDAYLYQAVQLVSGYADVHALEAQVERVRARRPSAYQRLILAVLDAAAGRMAQSVADLRELAESVSPDEDPDLFSRVATAFGFFSAMLDDHEQAIRWASRARETPGIVPFIESTARQGLVCSYAMTGRIGEALALLTDCSPEHGRPDAFETDLLALRGLVHTWAGEHQAAIADLRAVERWVRLGFPCVSATRVYAALAEAELRAGAWDDAATHAELAVSLAEAFEHVWYMPYVYQVATCLHALRGEDDLAAAHAAAARRSTGAGAVGEGLGYAALAEAHRAWTVGDWPAVSAALRPLAEAPPTVREHPNLAVWRYRLAEARIGEGRPDEALALLDEAPAAAWGGIETADRVRLRALALHRLGDAAAARAAFVEGMTGLQGPAATFAGALLCLDYGRFLLDKGERAMAVTPLRSAREVLRRLGATRLRDACDAALLAGGAGSDGAPAADPRVDTLTPRERVVANLVADGATNREVAAQLYLSVKGVEYHLGHIFAKLAITSRRQLRSRLLTGPVLGKDLGKD